VRARWLRHELRWLLWRWGGAQGGSEERRNPARSAQGRRPIRKLVERQVWLHLPHTPAPPRRTDRTTDDRAAGDGRRPLPRLRYELMLEAGGVLITRGLGGPSSSAPSHDPDRGCDIGFDQQLQVRIREVWRHVDKIVGRQSAGFDA